MFAQGELSQIFWLVLCLSAILLFCRMYLVPRVNAVFTTRDSYMHKCKAQTARVRGEIEKVGTIIAAAKKRNAEECERIVRYASLDAATKTEKQVDMLVQEQQKIADDVRQNTMQEVQNITMLDSGFVEDVSKCIVEKFVASDAERV